MTDMSLVSEVRCHQSAQHYQGSPPSFARLYHVTSPNSRPLYHPCTPPTSASFPTPSDSSCLGSLPYFHGWMFDPRSPASSSDVLSSTDSGLRGGGGGGGDRGSILKTDSSYPGAAVGDTPFIDYTGFSALLPQTDGSDGGGGVGGGGTQVRVRCVKRRVSANRKERRRTHSINSAFSALRGCIPNVPSDTKLSKIKTLRLATSYIAYLMDILNKDDAQLTNPGGFKAEITKKIESREEKRRRESEEILKASGRPDKPTKGRTGWPQQVWASELKQ